MRMQSPDLFKGFGMCGTGSTTEVGIARRVWAPSRMDGRRAESEDTPVTKQSAYGDPERKNRGLGGNYHNSHGYEKNGEPLSLESG